MTQAELLSTMALQVYQKIQRNCLRGWRQHVRDKARDRTLAYQKLQRCKRMAGGMRRQQMWAAERVHLILLMWHRYTKFHRAEKKDLPVPTFTDAKPLPEWTQWLEEYQEHKVMVARANSVGPSGRTNCVGRAARTSAVMERVSMTRGGRASSVGRAASAVRSTTRLTED